MFRSIPQGQTGTSSQVQNDVDFGRCMSNIEKEGSPSEKWTSSLRSTTYEGLRHRTEPIFSAN